MFRQDETNKKWHWDFLNAIWHLLNKSGRSLVLVPYFMQTHVRQTRGQSACCAPQATDAPMTLRPRRLLRKRGKEFSPRAPFRRRVPGGTHIKFWFLCALAKLRRNRSSSRSIWSMAYRDSRAALISNFQVSILWETRKSTTPAGLFNLALRIDWGSHFSAETKAAKLFCYLEHCEEYIAMMRSCAEMTRKWMINRVCLQVSHCNNQSIESRSAQKREWIEGVLRAINFCHASNYEIIIKI